jgi:hypothetical protein
MRIVILIFLTIISLLTSCYKVYDPHIDTAEKVLVVNGLITNQTGVYHVSLSYAKPFNSSEKGTPVSAANVYVTDNLGNYYIFSETGEGDYMSDSLQFTGKLGHTYRLHIVTPDSEEYESDPQRLFPEVHFDSIYAEFDNKEILEKSTGLKRNIHGAKILADVSNQSDTLPQFRITSDLVMQYYYYQIITIDYINWYHYDFFCWQTVDANPDINLTGREYVLSSTSIRNHKVCFFDDNPDVWALVYGCRVNEEDTTGSVVETSFYQFYMVHHRILYLNLYTLNNETYLYYKSLDEQMQSEGKLFDPVATQLNGNIKCVSDPERKAIGFFEASSVNNSGYIVDFRNLKNSQPLLIKTPYIMPPESVGCRINRIGSIHLNIPSFWIFI